MKKWIHAASEPYSTIHKVAEAKKKLSDFTEEQISLVQQCHDEINNAISRYYAENLYEQDYNIGSEISEIKRDYAVEADENDLLNQDEFNKLFDLLDTVGLEQAQAYAGTDLSDTYVVKIIFEVDPGRDAIGPVAAEEIIFVDANSEEEAIEKAKQKWNKPFERIEVVDVNPELDEDDLPFEDISAAVRPWKVQYEVHWISPSGRDCLLGGSNNIDEANRIARDQAQQIFENPFETNDRKYHFLDNIYVVDVSTEGDSMSIETEEYIDNLMSEIDSRKLVSSSSLDDKIARMKAIGDRKTPIIDEVAEMSPKELTTYLKENGLEADYKDAYNMRQDLSVKKIKQLLVQNHMQGVM